MGRYFSYLLLLCILLIKLAADHCYESLHACVCIYIYIIIKYDKGKAVGGERQIRLRNKNGVVRGAFESI